MENLVGLILTEGFRTNSEELAGVERLAVVAPAFLESEADSIPFPAHSLGLNSLVHGRLSDVLYKHIS